jgi:hypothetical protein
MRWLYVTIGLLATCACLIGWIYLRDRNTSWRPPEQQTARADATVANDILGANCRSFCATELLGQTGAHRWLVRVTRRGRPECLEIDVATFVVSQQHGLVGVSPRRCPQLDRSR